MSKLFLVFVIIISTSLHSMEPENQLCDTVKKVKQLNERSLVSSLIQSSPITLLQTYHQLSEHLCLDIARSILLKFSLIKVSLPITLPAVYYQFSQRLTPEIACHIFSFQCSDVQFSNFLYKIETSDPGKLMMNIDQLIKSYGYNLSVALFKHYFDHRKRSICDIKTVLGETVLHEAVYYRHIDVVNFLLDVLGNDAWNLLSAQDWCGHTALYYAVCDKERVFAVKLLLDAAGKNVQNLMAIKANDGKTVFDKAYSEAQDIMTQHMQKDIKS